MKKFMSAALVLLLLFFAACDDGEKSDPVLDDDVTTDDGDTDTEKPECDGDDCATDDADTYDDGDTDDGDTVPDGGDTDDGDTVPDDGDTDDSDIVFGETCKVTAGNGAKLIKGNILSGDKVYTDGEVLIGEDGFIVCVGDDCSNEEAANGATVIDCPGATVSPALINGHDHLGYVNNKPGNWGAERFDHRHDWRKGKNDHTKLNVPGNASTEQKQWAELRQLMAGTLSIAGSGGAKGFLRNIDQNFVDTYGLDGMDVKYQTFPLGDSDGTMIESGCGYSKIDKASVLQADCYLPHVSEGINKAARNEMLCLTGRQDGGIDLAKENSAFVHSVGIIAEDGKELADSKTAVIWSARTNISLYGNTAPVTMLKHQGVLIGLGTDWVASGSMHILRELACVDYLNKNHFNKTFSDYEIWQMATVNNAAALRILDVTGAIRPGLVGDIVVFDAQGAENPYRAVIEGHEKKVALVLRGGKVLYGDENVVAALDTKNECEKLSVCGVDKKVCVKETGMSLADFQSKNSDQYKLFYCGTPDDEPTCVPKRTRSQDESIPYSGPEDGDKDGDGIADEDDNCPDIFNPIRPVDNGKQADSDGDGVGDVCDPCPLDKNKSDCDPIDFDDKDGDGIINAFDNCPFKSNPGQEDSDLNGIGDACEKIAEEVTIYEIKQKNVDEGTYVKVEGIVTAYNSSKKNFFIQVAAADQDSTLKEKYSGLYIFNSTKAVAVGDRVKVTGTLQFYKDSGNSEIIEISKVKNVEIVSSNNALPAFVTVDPAKVKNGGELKDAYNGVLVKVENVNVTEEADSYKVFGVADGLKVDDDFYSYEDPAVGTHFSLLRGVLGDTFGYSKILPRSAEDFVIYDCTVSGCENSWEKCDATLGCIAKDGFCNSKAECPAVDKVCDTADTHTCIDGDPCEGVACDDSYQQCDATISQCVLQDGKCAVNSDCAAAERCNTATHECEEITSIIPNGGFEDWSDGWPTSWKGEKTTIAKSRVSKETTTGPSGAETSVLKMVGTKGSNSIISTKPFSIAAETEEDHYSCTYYAKGTTKIAVRTFLNSSLSNMSDYEELTDSWKKMTYTFTIGSAVEDFEFLIYIPKSEGDYAVVDDLICTKD